MDETVTHYVNNVNCTLQVKFTCYRWGTETPLLDRLEGLFHERDVSLKDSREFVEFT